ncbi:GNAT family N-acetyltransferase [Tsuneonella suprasediminis]|uniref:GNAT family N-acetyltransferase n=1 Tax=Tsuneonella suprasediminis TaxID=2306996 RepID=UPI001F0BA05F|nr:GNAT family protein [Tsuneonella suprasediminis]
MSGSGEVNSDGLYVPLDDGDIRLDLLMDHHKEALRMACAEDAGIWDVYPFNYLGDAFDEQFARMRDGGMARRIYAIVANGEVVGMTGWIASGEAGWSIEIGNSYIVPRLRGTGINHRIKKLMLDHAFAAGLQRVGFKVDAVNRRSCAAVLKLGCKEEGLLRRERRTWTGRVRDTAIFSILADEWTG